MNWIDWLLLILTVIVGYLVNYYRTRTDLAENVSDYIAQAEEMYKDVAKAGGQKFTWVVEKLHDMVPLAFKAIITEEMLGEIVQNVFDSIRAYTDTTLNKIGK